MSSQENKTESEQTEEQQTGAASEDNKQVCMYIYMCVFYTYEQYIYLTRSFTVSCTFLITKKHTCRLIIDLKIL